jgi:gamma-glutamyl-gamma-aminobutyraldehyde dehydrogenase/4-guanidinobutyraldehyde dehydrogenase/NAD-dependent aldehyde dehydrogenase
LADLHDATWWTRKRQTLHFDDKALIGGRLVAARSGETFDCISPLDGRVLTRIAACDAADVDLAVAAARKAFDLGPWPRMAARDRKKILLRLADLITRHADEFALLETLDMGMPIRDSVSVNVAQSAECMAWYAEAIDKLYDEVAPTGPDAVTLIRKAPLGVVGAVTPWNYPLMIACWKIAPILATGNTMVLKPAEQSPLTALKLATLAAEAGLPDGVLNVVPGFGPSAGQALGLHMDVNALTFTGSTEIGRKFLCYSGTSNMKKVALECGGKTPNIVLNDAPDLDKAAAAIARAIFFNQGEICNAGSRLIVEESLRADLLDRIKTESEKYRPGDPLDPDTIMGAMVDETHTGRVMDYIGIGLREGAILVTGGKRARSETAGCFIEPTILDGVRPDMRVAREEIFGPVLSVISVRGFDEAIKVANSTIYGLGAAVWTRDIVTAHRAADQLRAGVVWINGHGKGDISSPVGGFGQSGFGRDKSLHSLDKYQDFKTMWINLA